MQVQTDLSRNLALPTLLTEQSYKHAFVAFEVY